MGFYCQVKYQEINTMNNLKKSIKPIPLKYTCKYISVLCSYFMITDLYLYFDGFIYLFVQINMKFHFKLSHSINQGTSKESKTAISKWK